MHDRNAKEAQQNIYASGCLPSQVIYRCELFDLYSSHFQSFSPRWNHVSDGDGDFVVRRIEGAEEPLEVGAPRRENGLVARDRLRAQVEGDVGEGRVLRKVQKGVNPCHLFTILEPI